MPKSEKPRKKYDRWKGMRAVMGKFNAPPMFEISTNRDPAGNDWLCFHILEGKFKDHVFFLTGLDSIEEFSYSYAKLDETDGAELEALPPTEESSTFAIFLQHYFFAKREQIVDELKQVMYNTPFDDDDKAEE